MAQPRRTEPPPARSVVNDFIEQRPVDPRLADSVAGDEERRIVTVVFADIAGFTSLAEHLDPERVKRLIDSAFAQLVVDVESHGGTVDKVLGDGLVALFGAPVAHEDDADRAVRAALAMQESLRSFRDSHPADDVHLRIGINTGEVLVGTLAGTDYTAMGDVVNIAARLQELAPVDAVLVGDATRQLCSGSIRFEPVTTDTLRGRVTELSVWRAAVVDRSRVRRRWPFDVDFVGRRTELDLLGGVTRSVIGGRAAIVAVSGEPGIGKSRLVQETILDLVRRAPATTVLEGACAPYGESNVWWPAVGGLLGRYDFDRIGSTEELRGRVEARVRRFDDPQPDTPAFARIVDTVLYLLGKPSRFDGMPPESTRDAVAAALVAWIRARAALRPVALWIDDLHWSSLVLRDLLVSVARQMHDQPLLIITTARTEPDDASHWPPTLDPVVTVHLTLDPLGPADAAELVARAAPSELPDEVVNGIFDRSGGNPLFLIELARLAEARGQEAALPGSLRALIAARLDMLTPAQRSIVDNAAIIGNAGRTLSLREFAHEMGQPYVASDLFSLEASGLLMRDGPQWRFRSDVVREVAYETLTKQARAQRHAGVAAFLAAYEPELVDRRAHHLASAAELRAELGPISGVPDDVAEAAVEMSTEAALSWCRQGAARRAVKVAERALALSDPSTAAGRDLVVAMAQGLVEARQFSRARTILLELVIRGERIGDRTVVGESHRLLGVMDRISGELAAARSHLSLAVDRFRALRDEPRLAGALRERGLAEIFGGSLDDAERFLIEAEQIATGLGDTAGAAWAQQHRAWVSFLAGDHAASEQVLTDAIDAFAAVDDRPGRAWASGLLGYVRFFTRDHDAAIEIADRVATEAHHWGDVWGRSMMTNLRANVVLWQGDLDTAAELAHRSLSGFRSADDRFGVILALATLNRADAGRGRTADVERTLEEMLALSDSFGALAYPLLAAAGTLMHLGRGPAAVVQAHQAIERIDRTGASVDEAQVVSAFGHLLQGDVDAALADLEPVAVEALPFALAARATARVLVGDHAGAAADADRVAATSGVSYWDAAMAAVAGAACQVPDVGDRREFARRLGERLDDVVVRAYVARAVDGMDRRPVAGSAPLGDWARLADALVAQSVAANRSG